MSIEAQVEILYIQLAIVLNLLEYVLPTLDLATGHYQPTFKSVFDPQAPPLPLISSTFTWSWQEEATGGDHFRHSRSIQRPQSTVGGGC